MATALQANGQPRVIGDIVAIDAADIDATDRLRPIDPRWAEALGQIMRVEGQRTSIEVCRQKTGKPWRLVAGGHRHMAALLSPDLNPLRCVEVEADALSRRQAEISENLYRLDLEPIDRANFLAELHDVLRARSGLGADVSSQSIAANARWKKQLNDAAGDASATIARAYGFADAIADQFGFSKRTIQYDLMLARRLSGEVMAQLRGHPVATNAAQLRALARLSFTDQDKVVVELNAGAKTVAAALDRLSGKVAASAEDRRLSAFVGAYARMTLSEKKGALAQLAGMLPAGFALTGAAK